MQQKEVEIFYPATRAAWRKWLETNHLSRQAVWLVFYTKKSGKSTLTWAEAMAEALCYGWIDSKKIKIDEEKAHQFFSKRKPHSTWSKVNKTHVQRLIAEGLMTAAGYQSIEIAKQNGSWTILDSVEELIIPDDLEAAFATHPTAKDFFLRLSKSARKVLLQGLVLAKRPETRQKRITELLALADQKQKPRP